MMQYLARWRLQLAADLLHGSRGAIGGSPRSSLRVGRRIRARVQAATRRVAGDLARAPGIAERTGYEVDCGGLTRRDLRNVRSR